MSDVQPLRFLGLTKAQFLACLVSALIAVLTIQAWGLVTQRHLVSQGAQAHAALCVFRQDLVGRRDDSQLFLTLTPAERIEKYGPALGRIPSSVIRQQLKNQQATVDSLDALHC